MQSTIQVAFTIFIVTETWTAPIAGYLVDRFDAETKLTPASPTWRMLHEPASRLMLP